MNEMKTVSNFTIAELSEGQSFSFDTTISEAMIDAFAMLTGDVSPLHIDHRFATGRGFKGRVVHGALLCGLVSRLIGVHLPGRDCLLHSINMKFPMPTYANDLVRTKGAIEQISFATRAMTLQVEITNVNSQCIAAKGKVTVGFTEETGGVTINDLITGPS